MVLIVIYIGRPVIHTYTHMYAYIYTYTCMYECMHVCVYVMYVLEVDRLIGMADLKFSKQSEIGNFGRRFCRLKYIFFTPLFN